MQQPSPASTTTCRIHPMDQTDHEGKVLVELLTREPTGATFVQTHRVLPKDLRGFVAYQQQHLPRVQVEQVPVVTPQPYSSPHTHLQQNHPQGAYSPSHSQSTYSQGHPSQDHHQQHEPSTTPSTTSPSPQQQPSFSTSSIGGLAGYDKYGSSFGACTWNTTSAPGQPSSVPSSTTTSASPQAGSLVQDPNC